MPSTPSLADHGYTQWLMIVGKNTGKHDTITSERSIQVIGLRQYHLAPTILLASSVTGIIRDREIRTQSGNRQTSAINSLVFQVLRNGLRTFLRQGHVICMSTDAVAAWAATVPGNRFANGAGSLVETGPALEFFLILRKYLQRRRLVGIFCRFQP